MGGQAAQPSGLGFASDWATAIGNGADALLDGGKWHEASGRTTQLFDGVPGGEVVAADGLGFPAGMANVYRGLLYSSCDPTVRQSSPIVDYDTPAIGELFHLRLYFRVAAEPQVNVGVMHWLHLGGLDPIITKNIVGTGPGGRQLMWPGEGYWTYADVIAADHTYRFTVGLERTGQDQATARYIRLYDENEQLVVGEDGMTVESMTGGGIIMFDELTHSLAGDPDRAFRMFNIGPNDSLVSGYTGPNNFLYFGGFAVRVSASIDDEIGPYQLGEAD